MHDFISSSQQPCEIGSTIHFTDEETDVAQGHQPVGDSADI